MQTLRQYDDDVPQSSWNISLEAILERLLVCIKLSAFTWGQKGHREWIYVAIKFCYEQWTCFQTKI